MPVWHFIDCLHILVNANEPYLRKTTRKRTKQYKCPSGAFLYYYLSRENYHKITMTTATRRLGIMHGMDHVMEITIVIVV